MEKLNKLLDIYTSFGIEQDYDKLLEKILIEAVNFTNCDAGTLYIYDKNHLHFKIVMTKSQNTFENLDISGESHQKFPSVPMDIKNACAYCAINKRIVNIENVYSSSYDFTGPRDYDRRTGYKTKSMLIFPIENDYGDVVGVVQLINAMQGDEIVPFDTYFHNFLQSFGVQAGMCLNSMIYAKENQEQLHSFVEVLTTAIDELSKFNSNHSRNMTKYADNFLNWLDSENKPQKFNKRDRAQLLMSIRLHDIGKLTTPHNILNKVSRLDHKLEAVENRIEKFWLSTEVSYLNREISEDIRGEKHSLLEEAQALIKDVDKAEYIPLEVLERIRFLGRQEFQTIKGKVEPLLKEDELHALLVQRGNLTVQERDIMQNHVSITEKMLSKIKFTKEFEDVPFWASAHHEFLNGKGYPHQLKESEIPLAVRILTVLDVFEALVASDRPYKKPKSPKQATIILENMVRVGELDIEVVSLFIESKAWEL